jgi:hypothetical protein
MNPKNTQNLRRETRANEQNVETEIVCCAWTLRTANCLNCLNWPTEIRICIPPGREYNQAGTLFTV